MLGYEVDKILNRQANETSKSVRLKNGREKKYSQGHIQKIQEIIGNYKNQHFKILDIKSELDKNADLLALLSSTIRNLMKNELKMSFK